MRIKKLIAKLIAWFKIDWQKKAVLVGAALLALSAVLIIILMNWRNLTLSKAENGNTPVEPGVPVVKTYSDLYAVVIDNHNDALPFSGVSKAALVYEVPAEGQITRLLAVFERGKEVGEIGPVRSARPYFLDWAAELGPSLFLHFGGSPAALARIASTPSLREIDEDGMGNAGASYWRDEKRDMPHNAYTSSSEAEKLFVDRGGEARTVNAWLMAGDPAVEMRGQDSTISVNISNIASYDPEWHYSRERNIYIRYHQGKAQTDRDGSAIETKNVIIMEAPMKVLDDIGRLQVTTVGAGKATVYRNGEMIEATWKNEAAGAPVRFYASDGVEIVLTDGNVWIEVVPEGKTKH